MQKRKTKLKLPPWLWLGLILVVALGLIFGVRALTNRSARLGTAVRLPALPTHQIMPFGNGVLYYDGMVLTCASKNGSTRWSYQIGGSAGFHTDGSRVVAWSANQLYILDQNGKAHFNGPMTAQIQFARVGSQFVAVFVGESDNGSIYVVDRNGGNVDNIPVEYLTLLDIGFFTSEMNEMMWVMGLDTNGTIPTVTMQSFRPGTLAIGSISLGEQMVYRVYFHNAKLYTVDTWQIRAFDYRLREDSADPVLIYGWQLADVRQVGRDLAQLLVQTPSSIDGTVRATDLRLIMGSGDRVLHLPTECFGAALGTRSAYGFSASYVYACRYGETSFSAYRLPQTMDRYLGMVDDNCAIFSSGSDIYLIQLP